MADDKPGRLRMRYGEWALVTGASAGIGLEFARALARDGMSLILTARRAERLRAIAAELAQRHQTAVKVVVADLAAADGPARLLEAVSGLEIGMLINNAGFGCAGRFDKLDPARLGAMVQVNCAAPVMLTSALLKPMRERGRGAVIMVGSVAGHTPLPLRAVYAATKAFDLFLGEALWEELKGSGVDVLVLEPGPTATEFQSVAGEARPPGHGEPPARIVERAFRALGRQPSVVSGSVNWIRANVSRVLPRSATLKIVRRVMARQTPPEMR